MRKENENLRRRNLDYAIRGNLIIPLLFLDSEDFLHLINEAEAGKFQMIHGRGK
jgi:hypothetical protein